MVVMIPHAGVVGFVGKESGVLIALRAEGDEALFASRENAPLRWVKTMEFTPDPRGILSADEVREMMDEEVEEEDDGECPG